MFFENIILKNNKILDLEDPIYFLKAKKQKINKILKLDGSLTKCLIKKIFNKKLQISVPHKTIKVK